MYEIERKFKLTTDQFSTARDQLAKNFPEPQTLVQRDDIFIEPGKNLRDHKKGEPMARLRTENGTSIFTYKRTLLETGNRIEHESLVGDPQAMAAFLGEIGWELAISYEKERLLFSDGNLHFALDTFDGLGHFLEIEIVSDTDNQNAETYLFAEAQKLGINPQAQVEHRNYAMLSLAARGDV